MFKDIKIPYLRLIPILLIAFLLWKAVDNIAYLAEGIGYFFSLISYFIWGFAIAYLLNPMMVQLEKQFKMKRLGSILIIYTIFLGIVTFIVTIISPKIVRSTSEILTNAPLYLQATEAWLRTNLTDLRFFDRSVQSFVEPNLLYIIDQANNFLNFSINFVVSSAISVTSLVLKFVFGSILSIYLLKDKEGFINNLKRLIHAVIGKEKAQEVINFGKEVNVIFSRFLVGKAIDSLIIGLICFVGLMILQVPYPVLISVIVTVTNMIPYFGPLIGMVPAVIITLFSDPILAFYVLIFIVLLQQFDGWVLGPKILGDSVGLNPFWIIAAVIIGGGFFGVMGMLLGVPIMAVLKRLLERYIDKKLTGKDIKL